MANQSSLPWGVALILFIAYALVSSGTITPGPPVSAGAQPAAAAPPPPANPKEEGDLACLDVPPPLRPACRQLTPARTVSGELLSPAQQAPDCKTKPCPEATKHWEKQPWVTRAHKNLKVVIALVPDPEMTRLALYYGRALDSITLAAERADYLFDSYWVPWKTAGSRSAADTTKGLPPLVPAGLDPPSTLPGALLFRQSSSSWEPAAQTSGTAYLLVLLVGESNVSGLCRDQFKEALYYRSTLTPDAPEVPIIGPSYSGTFASLHKCLREDRLSFPAHTYRIVSSNTTVKEARRQMRESDLHVQLTAIQRDDESTMNALLHNVRGLGRIATLSEGDTAFGTTKLPQWGAKRGAPVITRISFPRGIAQLRDVYPEDTPSKPAAGAGPSTEQLPLSLRGSPAGSDTPEVFNVKHLTVAQEAQMQTIAGILNRGGFETAFIFASDVLDLTFVTGYLRQSCPNLRVIVQDWDLLFVQTTTKWSMDGVWVVTSLLPPPQNLLVPERHHFDVPSYWTPLLAASQFEHATYDAAYTVLSEMFPPRCKNTPADKPQPPPGCPDEHSRSSITTLASEQREPIWLSIVGRRSLWPVRDLDDAAPFLEAASDQAQSEDSPPVSGRLSRLTALLVCVIFCVAALYQSLAAYSILHPLLPSRVYSVAVPRPFRSFRWWEEGFEGRVGYHALGILLLGGMSYVLTAPFAHWRIEHLPLASLESVGLVLALLSLLLAALGVVRLLGPTVRRLLRHPEPEPRAQPEGLFQWLVSGDRRIPMLMAILTAMGVALSFLYYWRDLMGDPTTVRSHFLGLRALDAFSGVAPSLPVLLLGCGFLTLAWTQMSRHELYMRVRPDIPEVFPAALSAFQPGGPAAGPLTVAGFVAAATLIATTLLQLFERQSFDGPRFDHLYFAGLSVLWAALVVAAVRLYRLWRPLQCLLLTLERSPLRRAFTALPPEFASSPLLPSSRRQDHRIMLARSLDTLRALAVETKSTEFAAQLRAALPPMTRICDRYLFSEACGHRFSAFYFRWVQRALAEQARAAALLLQPVWAKGMAVKEGTEPPPKDSSKETSLAEEFLALRFLAVIRYSVSQMWCQIWFLALGFFFAVLSTTAYPFRSQGSIRWMTNLFLVILGIPVLMIVLRAERSSILRRLSANPDGKPGGQLVQLLTRLLVLGALPLLSVINSYVPLLGRFLSSWIEPLAAVPK
ncbi:hypothetical protein [Paludibaculum fermentans]|uniref:Uncharacterized protein n=1 Tax=Paludibaculum fermentans TaxID=1473598 RepID=A0A7S7NTV3_PALFE|nr:hypothetical protein [Paludibaculum fermentans]QOY89638.1 hypothetical protein IRI77_06710 [Paludibaculum fermentans]